ncbi:MAG: hypothetical protein KGZ50_02865 [Peptococcaceae bacterium]|nr:hypothetical protein [Peptococcaceae bacterium]
MSRRYLGGCSASTRAGDLRPVLGLQTSWLRRGRVGVPCHAATLLYHNCCANAD